MKTTRTETGEWLFIFPISHLVLTDAIKNELTIGSVTFITLKKLTRNRVKFGIRETIKNIRKDGHINEAFNRVGETLAVVKKNGVLKQARISAEEDVEEKLLILSVSQFFYNRKNQIAKLCISRKNYHSVESINLNMHNKSFGNAWAAKGTLMPLVLDETWLRFNKYYYFFDLLNFLKKEKSAFNKWDKTLYRSLILAGKSVQNEDLAQAFLLRMIAIEAVITGRNNAHQETVISFFKALIGWTPDWVDKKYEGKIKDIFTKRNNYIHDGNAENITTENLLFTELLLFNLYNNIFGNSKHFDSKEKLKELIDTSNAINTLNLKDERHRFLPKDLKYSFKY